MFENISKKPGKLVDFIHFFAILVGFIAISACVKNTDLVGYTFKSENLEQIKPGKTTESEVINALGTPSVTSTYGENSWYYISTEYETIAFLKPKIKNQKIFAITFGKDNKVSNIHEYSAKDAKDIKIVRDITKTEGHDSGIFGQLLGNVGRFNSEPGKPKISKPKSVPR